MRVVILFAVALLILTAAAACVPSEDPGRSGSVSTVETGPAATATRRRPVKISRCWEPPMPLNEVVSRRWLLTGIWNRSGVRSSLRRRWFSIAFDSFFLVDKIELVVTQLPAAQLRTRYGWGSGSDTRVLQERLIDVNTEDGQILEIAIEPARRLNEVLIVTLDSPSWVGLARGEGIWLAIHRGLGSGCGGKCGRGRGVRCGIFRALGGKCCGPRIGVCFGGGGVRQAGVGW